MKEPAWLTSLVDQRLALIEHALGDSVPDTNFIMTPLTEPSPPGVVSMQFWERACDNCATYCPDDTAFYTGHIVRTLRNGTQVFMTFGVCRVCQLHFVE